MTFVLRGSGSDSGGNQQKTARNRRAASASDPREVFGLSDASIFHSTRRPVFASMHSGMPDGPAGTPAARPAAGGT
jgi:hypothetical protein